MSTFTATEDAELRQGDPTACFGTSASLYLSPYVSGGSSRNAVIKFGGLPPGGVIGATLRLEITSLDYGFNGNTYRLRRSDWVENELSWNQYKAGATWSTGGARNTTNDIYPTDMGSYYIGGTGTKDIALSPSEVNLMCAANNGLLLLPEDAGTATAAFYSSEGATPPQLILIVAGGSQVIMVMAERWKGFLRDLRAGLVPSDMLRRTYRELVQI